MKNRGGPQHRGELAGHAGVWQRLWGGGVQGRQERRRGLQKAQTLQKLSDSRAGCGLASHSFQLASQACFRTYCHTLQPLPSVCVRQVGQGRGLWVYLGMGDRDATERATGGLAGDSSTQRRPREAPGAGGGGRASPPPQPPKWGGNVMSPAWRRALRKRPARDGYISGYCLSA